jgi:predicted ATP-grasp superfamily ATP-dependent carboligase
MFNRTHDDQGYLLLLGADNFLRERAIVGALRVYQGMVVGMQPRPLPNRNRMFDHIIEGDPNTASRALDAVQRFEATSGLRPDAVVPVSELGVEGAFAIARRYGCPSISEACLPQVRDKDAMKRAFARAGVPTARHATYATLHELRAAARALRFPLVLKPRECGGSVGTIKVDTPEGLEAGFRHCQEAFDRFADNLTLGNGRFQAEELVDATHEVSVEVLCHPDQRWVLAVTDKFVSRRPYFAEIGHLVPSRESGNEALARLAGRACEAVGITRGVAHVEVLINDRTGDMNVVEVGARPGGGGIMELVDRVYGFNPYELHVASYLDRLDSPPGGRRSRGAAGIAFLKAAEGTIAAIHLPQELPPEARSLYVTAKVGDRSGRHADSSLAREGAVEFFWPQPHGRCGEEMIERACALSAEIFEVSPDLIKITEAIDEEICK